MGYRIRVLGRNIDNIPLDGIRTAAAPAIIETDEAVDDSWEAIVLKHDGGDPIAFIEKNPVVEGELGHEEILEFIEEVGHYKPESGAAWLRAYLPTVKVIYSFQLLNGTYVDDGWTPLHSVYGFVWNHAGGILEAEGEGFSNEQGCTILWQFGDKVSGPWNMGVLDDDGKWVNFEMDLGDEQQRAAFQNGRVPAHAKLRVTH
jgi:hypothetical protein